MIFNCFVNKFVNFVRYFFCAVKKGLLFIILPIERKVLHTNGLPKIAQLSACRIDHSGDFVGDHKLQILKKRLNIRTATKFESLRKSRAIQIYVKRYSKSFLPKLQTRRKWKDHPLFLRRLSCRCSLIRLLPASIIRLDTLHSPQTGLSLVVITEFEGKLSFAMNSVTSCC